MSRGDWLPGDVVLYECTDRANARTRAIHSAIQSAQKTLGYQERHARFTHVALFIGDDQVYEAVRDDGVRRSRLSDACENGFRLQAIRWQARVGNHHIDCPDQVRLMINHCEANLGQPYSKRTIVKFGVLTTQVYMRAAMRELVELFLREESDRLTEPQRAEQEEELREATAAGVMRPVICSDLIQSSFKSASDLFRFGDSMEPEGYIPVPADFARSDNFAWID